MEMPTHIVAVGGIVEDGKGNILLVKTVHRGWEIPGGQVEAGENLTDALMREIKEESGVDAAVSQMIGVYSNTGKYIWHDGETEVPTKVMFDFICEYTGGELGVSDETTDSRWVEKDKVLEFVESPAIRTRYQAFLDFKGKINYMEYVTKPFFELKVKRSV